MLAQRVRLFFHACIRGERVRLCTRVRLWPCAGRLAPAESFHVIVVVVLGLVGLPLNGLVV